MAQALRWLEMGLQIDLHNPDLPQARDDPAAHARQIDSGMYHQLLAKLRPWERAGR